MAPRPARFAGFLRFDSYSSIILNQQDTLQFYVEIRSPRARRVQGYVTCFASDLEPWGFRDIGESEDERIERLWHWLSTRILTFAVDQKPGKTRGQVHWNAYDIRVHPFDVEKGDLWLYIPVPRLERYAASVPLLEAIQRGNPIRDFLPPEAGGRDLITAVHDRYLGPFKAMGSAGGLGGGLKASRNGIGDAPIQADGLLVIDDGDWLFVEEQLYEGLLQQLSRVADSAPITALPEAPAGPAIVMDSPSSTPPQLGGGAPPSGGGAVVAPPRPIPVTAPPVTAIEHGLSIPSWSEEGFLQRLEAEAVAQDLYYRPGELMGFHAAIKSGPLVILAGLSGAGKSRMVEVYRRALGLKEHDEFLWLPVRPSWNDDADLIGYYDPLHQQYRPGETGLVDLLVRAERQPDQLFMVCFDEMNLARVEHYFSQFLSILERPPEQRTLRLYARELAPDLQNADRYPPEVTLGPNLLLCGTINLDESTHSLSDKVLDRASVIRMGHVDIGTWWQQACQSTAAGGSPPPTEAVSYAQWRAWQRSFDPRPFGQEIALLESLNEALAEGGADQTFGYRVARQILVALQNLPRQVSGAPLLTPAAVLDGQIAQRVLPKIRGSRDDLEGLLGPQGSLRRLLTGSALSPFTITLAEIERKWQELERHEFTA